MRFRINRLRYSHEVTILDPSRVLLLETAEEIDRFTRAYGMIFPPISNRCRDLKKCVRSRTNTGRTSPVSEALFRLHPVGRSRPTSCRHHRRSHIPERSTACLWYAVELRRRMRLGSQRHPPGPGTPDRNRRLKDRREEAGTGAVNGTCGGRNAGQGRPVRRPPNRAPGRGSRH